MRRAGIALMLLVGWILLMGSAAAPLLGMGISLLDRTRIATDLVRVPSPGRLLGYSLTVSLTATVIALAIGIGPAVLLESRSQRRRHLLTGICVAPLLIPPQVYAYAWGLATAPDRLLAAALPPVSGVSAWGSAWRAGVISGGWLWPLVTLTVAAGWRSTGRSVYMLALLDTSPVLAFWRGVLPTLRSHLLAAACLVFIITLVEFPIPHLSLARTYATELLLLVDVGAPPGQVIATALPAIGLVLIGLALAALATRGLRSWGGAGEADGPDAPLESRRWAHAWLAVLTLVTVIVPVGVMAGSLRIAGRWREAFTLFREEWLTSCGLAVAAAAIALAMTVASVVLAAAIGKHSVRPGVLKGGAAGASSAGSLPAGLARAGAGLAGFGALVPGAALGIGFVVIYNRAGLAGWLYADTPVVWAMALAARYAIVPLVIVWLSLRRRPPAAIEQAQIDGAGAGEIMAYVLLPMLWAPLLAGGAIVALLALSEVVVSQLVHPVGYDGIALAILQLMHYGRDDTVIIASLLIVTVGVLLAQLASRLLLRRT